MKEKKRLIMILCFSFFFITACEYTPRDEEVLGDVVFYNVVFDYDSGLSKVETRVIRGEKINEPKNPQKSGYVFLGWYYNNQKYDFNTSVDSDVLLVAKWEKMDN